MNARSLRGGCLSAVFALTCVASAARAVAPVADRAAAAAAAGARDQVPALRDPDAAERPAGGRRAAPRAAGRSACGCWCAAGASLGSEGQARARAPRGLAARPGHDDASRPSEMNDAIDFIGGAMGAGAGTDLTFVNMVVMKDSFDAGMRMLSDMARQPGVRAGEIERQRQQMLSGLQVSLEDPEYIANSVFDRLVYGFHPYGMPAQRHAADDRGHHARRSGRVPLAAISCPNNAILAIVGDVTAEEAFDGGEESLRRLGEAAICRRRPSSSRPTRRAASSSSTSRMRCRPRSASATSASRATTPTTWR